MKLIWTKSGTPLSYAIRHICGDDCSHFSFVFESSAKGLMFESNLLGTHPSFLQTSLKSHTIVHDKTVNVPLEVEDLIWDEVVSKYDGKGYDFGGAAYLGLMVRREKTFKIPRPTANAWAKEGRYFCDEVYDVFNKFPKYFPKIEVCNGMDTPHDMFLKYELGERQ